VVGTEIPGDIILISFSYPSASRPSCVADSDHPARAWLHDVMRKIWNDHADFRQSSGRIINSVTSSTTGTSLFLWRSHDKSARVCVGLMLFVNCCRLFLELLNYHPVRGKTASANALEMTISSWFGPEYSLCRAFRTQSAESMGALGKFEVVLATLLSM
jgi:hypothetical protein